MNGARARIRAARKEQRHQMEIVSFHRQMERQDNAYLQTLKRRAFLLGVDLMGFSTHQTFLSPDADKRQKNIDHTIQFSRK